MLLVTIADGHEREGPRRSGDRSAAAGKTYIAGPSDAKFPDKSDALPHRLPQEQSIDLSFIVLRLSERRTRRRQNAACRGIRPAASSWGERDRRGWP